MVDERGETSMGQRRTDQGGQQSPLRSDRGNTIISNAVVSQVTEAARRNVINRVENLVGLRVAEVNITVNDVQFPEERPMLGQQQEVERQAREQEMQA